MKAFSCHVFWILKLYSCKEPVVIVSSPNVAHTSKQSSKIKKKRKAASSLLLHPDSFPASGDATSPNGIIIVDTADDTSADYVAVNHDEELLCDAQVHFLCNLFCFHGF